MANLVYRLLCLACVVVGGVMAYMGGESLSKADPWGWPFVVAGVAIALGNLRDLAKGLEG